MTSYTVTTPPTELPVSLQEAKTHLRILDTTYDTEIEAFIERATGVAELYTNLSLMEQEVKLYFSSIPNDGIIEVRRAPVISIDGVYYHNGTEFIETEDIQIDDVSKPARIKFTEIPDYDREQLWAGYVEFTAGYPDAASVPVNIKQAILMLVASFFENRGDEGHRSIPESVWMLLNQSRVKMY